MPRGQWDQLLAMAEQQYGTALPMESLETFGSGDRMTVTYTYADGRIDQTDEPWVRERGGWHNDDC
jgi:hypothetical protein